MDKIIRNILYKLDCKDNSWKYDEVQDRMLRDFKHMIKLEMLNANLKMKKGECK